MRSSVSQRHISALCRTSLHDVVMMIIEGGFPIGAGGVKYINALNRALAGRAAITAGLPEEWFARRLPAPL
jgi:hypothetical protein